MRASAGSVFHGDVVRGASLDTLLPSLQAAGATVLAADGGGQDALDEVAADGRLAGPVVWLFGNEARGVPAALARRCCRVESISDATRRVRPR